MDTGFRRWALPISLVLAVLAAGYAVWAGVSWWGASTGDSATFAKEREEVLRVGQVGIANFTTLDYRQVDQDLQRWLETSTGDLQKEIQVGKDSRKKQIQDAKSVTVSRVLDAAVTELDERAGKAHVIAVVETTVTPEGGQAVKKINRYQTDLSRTDDGWKLSALGPVAAGGA